MVAADLPGGAWMTATAGEAVLASDFSLDLTSANNGVYQSPTLSVSLDPGTYFIMGIANCQLFAQFGFQLRIRLFNSTTSAAITSTEAKGVFASGSDTSAETFIAPSATSTIITLASASTIALQVAWSGTGTGDGIESASLGSSVGGRTKLSYIRLA